MACHHHLLLLGVFSVTLAVASAFLVPSSSSSSPASSTYSSSSKQKRQSEVSLTPISRYTTVNQDHQERLLTPTNETLIRQFSSLDDILRSSDQGVFVMTRADVKPDNCKARRFNQTLKFPGCESREISNNQCHGRCNSFFIPADPELKRRFKGVRGSHRNRNGTITAAVESEYLADQDLTRPQFMNCPVCRPHKTKWITLTLSCPDLNPKYRKIRIKKVKGCSCREADAPN